MSHHPHHPNMAETNHDTDLFAISVDADDYAPTATTSTSNPTPTDPRTYQSEPAYLAQKTSYTAKLSTGNHYAELLTAVPALQLSKGTPAEKVKLSKKNLQLLEYAVGEMYYDGEFGGVVEVCGRVGEVYLPIPKRAGQDGHTLSQNLLQTRDSKETKAYSVMRAKAVDYLTI
ncbi:hypothetical protein EJ03DRAFT_381508 [Teratosphaeria nubilosa]|uniref:Uncharacterized protein n=1 Tax=Teratosphaeria nubilosa TaxID=161662 RepID=A0A6G1LEE5_9PEZI|nr:hypothetical protein EJ03DRAFT_381508 [Teratosphaeria nubilosa]